MTFFFNDSIKTHKGLGTEYLFLEPGFNQKLVIFSIIKDFLRKGLVFNIWQHFSKDHNTVSKGMKVF